MARRRALRWTVIGAVALAAVAYWKFDRTPPSFDLAATKLCLEESAVVREIPRPDRRFPAYPGLSVRFRSDSTHPVALYFAPIIDEAEESAWSDSEHAQRRRNVLTEYVAGADWDERVLACLSERGSR